MQFEEALRIHVSISMTDIHSLTAPDGRSATMIPFTGTAEGKYFNGKVLSGGVDTQIAGTGGTDRTLSARYMLEGKDADGQRCKVYIDNSGIVNRIGKTIPVLGNPMFRTHPTIITDSEMLSFLHRDLLIGEGMPTANGIDIVIYRAL